MTYVWLVVEGRFFNGEGEVVDAYSTKKKAEKETRKQGFKWDSSQGMFCNESAWLWRQLKKMEVW
jgi:hypothetical protein